LLGRSTIRSAALAAGLLAIGLTLAALASSEEGPSRAKSTGVAGRCDRTVAPATRSVRAGHRRPAIVQRLVNSLHAGQTGCLRGGTYVEDVKVSQGRIALRSYPGEQARLVGRLWFSRSARKDVFSHLTLDGRNAAELPSPTVNGSAISFVDNEVTNANTSICFLLGSPSYGRARDTLIEGNRIHDCGRLPANNHEHGIYVERADRTRIVGNLIYDNADRGIQLYPNAQYTVIERNVIDGNGEGIIFSGDEGLASNHNLVQFNVVSHSRIRADIESYFPSGNPVGVGNLVRNNCVFGGRKGPIETSDGGFTAVSNVVADPLYANAAGGDFRIGAGSRCASLMAGRLASSAAAARAAQLR
jgi:parallel beta-helix repeat protein